jgi:hypothetical protein
MMSWLLEKKLKTLNFYTTNSMWSGKLYFRIFIEKKIVQSKYNVIVSKFKMLLEIGSYIHNYYDFII